MSPSGHSFQDDIRTIRERRGVPREEIHERTKISLENIERFERGELDRHPHFNDVYLRALVRAYAEALGISEEVALQGLERERTGTYEGELGRVYLDRDPEESDEDAVGESRDEEGAPESRMPGAAEEGPGSSSAPAEVEAGESRGEEVGPLPEESPEPEDISGETEEDVPIPRVGGSPLEIGEESEGEQPAKEEPDELDRDEDEVAQDETAVSEAGTPPAAGVSGGGEEFAGGRSVSRSRTRSRGSVRRSSGPLGSLGGDRLTGRLVLGGGVLVLLGALIWVGIVLYSGSESTSTEEPEAAPPAADTARTEAREPPAPPPLPEIGDSLEVTVVAETDVLEPVRVREDDGPWNPYWIEQGDSMTFGAEQSIELRSYLPRARVRVERMDWPLAVTSSSDSVLITREAVQRRIDSVVTARTPGARADPDTAEASPAAGEP